MSYPLDLACKFAIEQAKKRLSQEVGPDDLLLGCFRTLSQFGIVQLGGWTFDLEALGLDWLSVGEQKKAKVAYSQAAVELLDLASRIARSNGKTAASVEDLLAAYAGRGDGLMGKLKRDYAITSAEWRAAVAELWNRACRTSVAAPEATPSKLGEGREYLTPEEAAETLSIHVQTLRAHVRSGRLPALRLAGERAIRIRRVDLEKVFEPAVMTD
jgi:excisionase family DNA binding protein